MKRIEDHRSFGGRQQVWEHDSAETGTPMRFSVFLPPQAEQGRLLGVKGADAGHGILAQDSCSRTSYMSFAAWIMRAEAL